MAIETFTLTRERCLLVNLNIRTEMHGDDREAAADLKFSFSGANNLLLKLHPDLRAAFYRANDTRDLVNPDHMPHLRFPMLGALPWDLEIPRTRLRVHDAEDAQHDVVLGGGKTNKFKLTLKEGGTVEWEFRCQFSKPDEEAVAKLMRVLNQVVPITLECADEEEKPDNFDKVDLVTQAAHSPARIEAESLFDAPPTTLALAPDDVVDATYTPPAATVADAVAAVVESIDKVTKPKRVTKAAEAPAAEEKPKSKRASRPAAEVE